MKGENSCPQPGGDVPRDTRWVRKEFMAVAKTAGVGGRHVKPHTCRHTVLWTLDRGSVVGGFPTQPEPCGECAGEQRKT